jgi:hypothetical protein
MGKDEKEKKGKGFLAWWAGGDSGPAGCRCERGRGRAGPARPKGERRRRRVRRRCRRARRWRRQRAHAPRRAGGETASARDGAGANRPTRGENPAAGGFNGDSPLVAWFLGIGQVPKNEKRLASLMVGPISPEVTGRGLTTMGWRSSAAGVVACEVWVVIGGRGAVFRVCGAVVKLLRLVNCLLNNQRGGGGEGAHWSGGRGGGAGAVELGEGEKSG